MLILYMYNFLQWFTPPFRPIGSALLTGGLSLLACVMTKIAMWMLWVNNSWENIWIINYTFILLYTILASVFILYYRDQLTYFNQAITFYMALVGYSLLANYLFTGVSPFKSGYFVWILVVITLFFLIIISISRTVYRLVQIAEKQDKKLRNED